MRRIIVFVMVLGLALLALLATLGFGSAMFPAAETTVDIGARWDEAVGDGRVLPATFVPKLGRSNGISKAIVYMKERIHLDAVAINLPIKTTVGLFTGQPEGTQSWVQDVRVRVVVFDQLPIGSAFVPQGSRGSKNTRFTMVLNDATGEFLYGTLTGEYAY